MEVRSLNQRFLDIYIKAPSFMNQHEMTFRNIIRERFSRGKFDVSISLSGKAAGLRINKEVAGGVFNALRSLQGEFVIPGEVDINSISLFHETFMEPDTSYEIEEIRRVFEEAVDSLQRMRMREGQLLAGEVGRLVGSLETMKNEVKAMSAAAAGESAARLKERVALLLGDQEVDPMRMHQEIALLAAKSDITEEIARFESHIRQFREILGGDDVMGRKLDFLVQELNREVNTMSSKSADYRISRLTVDMKTEIEKIREQVQNLQ